ncbi:helix-turn-helix domain-containing protein [Nocardiopsis sp. YSL2]|uniref:helix-turn-helix domain-containing protein n=1 Tax=Nocardiopsis sp. YSL2 TaxID=2939492 RepID=UPI0026F4481B|nr:helix-turn-helix domain-containing protein [Nocardiopsis sp. YSL2]
MTGKLDPSNQRGKRVFEQEKRGYSASSGDRRDQDASSPPTVYTPAEAAALLKVPESWLRKRVSARQVPCTFIGKHLRFSATDIEQIIESGHRAPVSRSSRPRRRADE